MIEPMAQATALLEHFSTEVVPGARVIRTIERNTRLCVPVLENYEIIVRVSPVADGLQTEVFTPRLHKLIPPDDLARVGGMLIQISNLVRQIRALAGGNASDSSRSQTAV